MAETNRQARAEATRRQLVEAAATVFAERGYRGATVAAITAEAGTAHGTFYLHFRNREDVFVHVVTDLLDELYQHAFTPFEDLPEKPDPLIIRERIAGFLEVCARHGGLWRALVEGALASPVVEAHWLGQRRRLHETLVTRIRHYWSPDEARGRDPELTAYALGSMLEWYALSRTVFDTPGVLEVTDPVVDTLTDVWLRTVGTEP